MPNRKLYWPSLLTVLFPVLASAQDYKVGNWAVVKSTPGFQIAMVANGDNSTGIVCEIKKDSCYAYVAIGSTCEDGEPYPILLNAPTGAFASMATCRHMNKKFQILEIDEFEKMISAFESGGEIGYATPMQSGQFKVVRFSTTGATAALKAARARPPADSAPPKAPAKKVEFL